jgi:lysophospholipase L1-like esterase
LVGAAVAAVLLGGCGVGGSHADRGAPGAGTPTVHISDSAGAAGGGRDAGPTPATTPTGAPTTAPTSAPTTPATTAPARPWNPHPRSVAAIGDSITRGFNACDPYSDCPDASWATGDGGTVDSISARLGDSAHSWNLAVSGAHVADLPGQAREAAAHKPAMVTVLIGANDVCAPDTDAMTSVADFRGSFAATLAYLHSTLPGTQVLVASIPDLEHLWRIGRDNVVERQLWRLGLCPTMLGDATSQSAAAQARRAAVTDRIAAFDTVLAQECARYARCRYDGGAVHRYAFTSGELSRWDWFHPNKAGQAELARILAGVLLSTTTP